MDRDALVPIQTLIANYLTQLADWRRARYQDDLKDQRNLRSADGIEDLRDHIRRLPADDARVVELDRLWRRGEFVDVGPQASYETGRFRFFIADTGIDAFLDQLVELARSDANEHGHRGGLQVPGDDGIDRLWDDD